jgi:hypothetical protein
MEQSIQAQLEKKLRENEKLNAMRSTQVALGKDADGKNRKDGNSKNEKGENEANLDRDVGKDPSDSKFHKVPSRRGSAASGAPVTSSAGISGRELVNEVGFICLWVFLLFTPLLACVR